MSQFKPHLIATLFNDTTNSYKFYWFLAILNRAQNSSSKTIPISDLAAEMLDLVWYPLSYFKLSFGTQDQFATIASRVDRFVDPTSKASILDQVRKSAPKEAVQTLEGDIVRLTRYVPYRFLRPFFSQELKGVKDHEVDSKIKSLSTEISKRDSNRLPYSFGEECIIINEPWLNYFRDNISLLENFCYWGLAAFVQKYNPNVPGISLKLFRPEARDLGLNRKSWSLFLEKHPESLCIYTHTQIPEKFSLDHFLPWSFVTHDHNWNIVPVSKDVNSSKGSNLPSLKEYLPGLTDIQWSFVQTLITQESGFGKLLEQYVLLFNASVSEIAALPKEKFRMKLEETIRPQYQIASNMPFISNWKFRSL